MVEWLSEKRVSLNLDQGQNRYLVIDNFPSQYISDEVQSALENYNTSICYLPRNATHLVQPADSFIFKMLKEECV